MNLRTEIELYIAACDLAAVSSVFAPQSRVSHGLVASDLRNILAATALLEAGQTPETAPTPQCRHHFREYEVCAKCGQTEAALTECHHCDTVTPATRCWWCLSLKAAPTPDPPAETPTPQETPMLDYLEGRTSDYKTPTCGHSYMDAGDDGPIEVTCRLSNRHAGPHAQWPEPVGGHVKLMRPAEPVSAEADIIADQEARWDAARWCGDLLTVVNAATQKITHVPCVLDKGHGGANHVSQAGIFRWPQRQPPPMFYEHSIHDSVMAEQVTPNEVADALGARPTDTHAPIDEAVDAIAAGTEDWSALIPEPTPALVKLMQPAETSTPSLVLNPPVDGSKYRAAWNAGYAEAIEDFKEERPAETQTPRLIEPDKSSPSIAERFALPRLDIPPSRHGQEYDIECWSLHEGRTVVGNVGHVTGLAEQYVFRSDAQSILLTRMAQNLADVARLLVQERQAHASALRWKDAIIDAAIVHWTLAAGHEDDPRAAVNALLRCAAQQALDPLISGDAQELIASVRREAILEFKSIVNHFRQPQQWAVERSAEEKRAYREALMDVDDEIDMLRQPHVSPVPPSGGGQ